MKSSFSSNLTLFLQEKANLHNEKMIVELIATVKQKMLQEIEKSSPELSFAQLNNVFQSEMQVALTRVSISHICMMRTVSAER